MFLIKKKLCNKPLLHPKLQTGPHTSMEEKKIAASAAVNWMSERGIECALLIIEVWSPKPGGSVPTKKKCGQENNTYIYYMPSFVSN